MLEREAPLPLTPPPKSEAPLPLMFIREAPLPFVLFDVEAVENEGLPPSRFGYCYNRRPSVSLNPGNLPIVCVSLGS